MTKETNDKLLKIIEHYGVNHQLRKFNEECYELMEAIFQYEEQKRACEFIGCSKPHCDSERKHIAEELSDCLVMLLQFKEYYGITDEQIKSIMNYKIDRQIERIKNEKVKDKR